MEIEPNRLYWSGSAPYHVDCKVESLNRELENTRDAEIDRLRRAIQSARIALETVPQTDTVWYDDMTTMVDFFDHVLSGFDPKRASEGND